MNYRNKAITCVKDSVLPIQKKQFMECGCNLDEQYKNMVIQKRYWQKL
ncbi:hypothetical protein [uncultured Fusobacterium sp.]|nr:hypothetical protein [uncultured Fusobacterium sp.]